MKTSRFLTSRLASKAGTRTAELHVKADSAGDAIGVAIRSMERAMLDQMRPGVGNVTHNYHVAFGYLQNLPGQIWHSLRGQIANLFLWSHHEAAGAMLRTLPKAHLRAATAGRMTESKTVKILEHGPVVFGFSKPPLSPFGLPTLTTESPVLTTKQEEDLWRAFLFPPPSAEYVKSILDVLLPPAMIQGSLFDLIGTPEKPATPQSLATTIAQAYSEGKSTAEVGRIVRPYFEGSAMRAERSARTLGAYVGTERNFATSEALGTLVIGYQVHSAGGENARHNHAMRSGTIYYREPKGDQVGMDVMPHPPQDTGRGPYDIPGGGTAWNCRCWLSPVLRPLAAMDSPAFTDNADKLIPDVSHFADWFATATNEQRAKAAGVRRIATATAALGRAPTWADLVNPDTGKLLSVENLERESPDSQRERANRVNIDVSINRALVRRVAAYGSI